MKLHCQDKNNIIVKEIEDNKKVETVSCYKCKCILDKSDAKKVKILYYDDKYKYFCRSACEPKYDEVYSTGNYSSYRKDGQTCTLNGLTREEVLYSFINEKHQKEQHENSYDKKTQYCPFCSIVYDSDEELRQSIYRAYGLTINEVKENETK